MNRSLAWIAQQLAPRADFIAAGLAMALAAAFGIGLAGCGGRGDDVLALRVAPALAPAARPAPVATVRLEGCVVDDYFQPRSQTPVRALAADGRLLGNAQSDGRGAFSLQLPVGQYLSLAVDRPDGEVMKVASGQHSRALTTCLVDPSA